MWSEAVKKHLRLQGIARGPIVTAEQVVVFEKRYGVQLPGDVREYFEEFNGSELGSGGPMDDQLLAFWHLSEVRPLSEELPDSSIPQADRYFVFADHSIWVHAYAIRLSSDPSESTPVVVVYDAAVGEVAPSMSAFFERYLAGDQTTLYPDPANLRQVTPGSNEHAHS